MKKKIKLKKNFLKYNLNINITILLFKLLLQQEQLIQQYQHYHQDLE